MEEQFDTPILYLIFDRPDLVKQTFPQIKAQRPKQLFIGADGPREGNENDKVKCAESREWVLAHIDWECEVNTLFREENLGCAVAVSGAITWFFEHVEMGIILEDDILVDPSFFHFVGVILNRYRNEHQVFGVTGLNWQDGRRRGRASYFFSHFPGIWGWGTWRDRWQKFELNPDDVQSFLASEDFVQYLGIEKVKENLKREFADVRGWAYRWRFQVFKHQGLIVVPEVNLVKNLGFNADATHTKGIDSRFLDLAVNQLDGAIIHPKDIELNRIAEKYMLKRNYLQSLSIWAKIRLILMIHWK